MHQYAAILQVAFCFSWAINDYPWAICQQDTADSDISHKLHTETHATDLFRLQTLNSTDVTGITPKCVLSALFPFSTPQELLH